MLRTTALLLAPLLAAACGERPAEEPPPSDLPTTYAKAVEQAGGTYPLHAVLDGGVEIHVDRLGRGLAAERDDRLQFHYRLFRAGDEAPVESSWDLGRPVRFTLGHGKIVPGLERALEGMPQSTRARVAVPAALAFGRRGNGAGVGPDVDVIFEIELWHLRR